MLMKFYKLFFKTLKVAFFAYLFITIRATVLYANGGGNVCGNDVVEFPEECDDNNTDNGDGCSSECKIERLDHFLIYKIDLADHEEVLAGTGVVKFNDQFSNQFGEFSTPTLWRTWVGVPVVKNDEPTLFDPDTHLTGFQFLAPPPY